MNDLEAVRRLAAEPTDESVARTWHRITKLESRKTSRTRRRLVPAFAALAVIVVVGVSLVVARVGERAQPPAASAEPTPSTAASNAPAIAALMELAAVAGNGQAITVAKGQLVRTVTTGTAGSCYSTGCEMSAADHTSLYDPHLAKSVNPGDKVINQDGSEVVYPVGLHYPSIDWLASLPTDLDALLTKMRGELPHRDPPMDKQIWDAVIHLYAECEIVLQPALRAALLRVLATMPALSVRSLVVDGVTLTAIGRVTSEGQNEILFDPATGHAVGFAAVPYGYAVRTMRQDGSGGTISGGWSELLTWKQTLT